jgi:hypothetical protein
MQFSCLKNKEEKKRERETGDKLKLEIRASILQDAHKYIIVFE